MTKSRIAYPTDLNDTEYARIAPLLETDSNRGRPREIPYREILNAIFYVLKTGCGWRELPHDLPKWYIALPYPEADQPCRKPTPLLYSASRS